MIGVYDSGLGAITVLSHLLKELPNEEFLCLIDNENAPYGEKEKEVLDKIITKNIETLIDKGCKIIAIACNTASTFVSDLRKKFDIPIVAIEPAIKMVYDNDKDERTLVLATPYTIQSEKFKNLFYQYSNDKFILLPCPNLASLIEEYDYEKLRTYLKELLTPYKDIKQVVLGCTHYPLIKKELQEFLPHALLYDGGKGVSLQTKRVLVEKGLLHTKKRKQHITFIFTNGKNYQEKFLQALDTYKKQC